MSDAGQQSVTFDMHTELDAGTRVCVETREFMYAIDEPESRAGYQQITASIQAELPAVAGDLVDDETEREWLERTKDRCPVGNNLTAKTPVDFSLK
jgi:predicted nucleic acid-binding OB-fold protein